MSIFDEFGSDNLFNDDLRQTWDPLAPVHRRFDQWRRGRRGAGGGMSADSILAQLTRQQYDDYVSNFMPIENGLIDYATNPETVTNAMAEAKADVNRSFTGLEGTNDRRLRSMGLSLDPDEQKSVARSMGLAKSLASAQAQAMARDATMARQQSILGNPAPVLGGG